MVLASLYIDRFMPNAGLEGLGPLIVGEALGVLLGGAFGVFVALKMLGRKAAAPTAALTLAGLLAWAVVSIPSFNWLVGELSGNVPEFIEVAVPVAVLALPPPIASRWLVLHNERVRKSREENSD